VNVQHTCVTESRVAAKTRGVAKLQGKICPHNLNVEPQYKAGGGHHYTGVDQEIAIQGFCSHKNRSFEQVECFTHQ
jgi:hypothetical protein